MSLLQALCNVCKHPILVDTSTGVKFDAPDIGHKHKTTPPKIIPGQYSAEQIMSIQKQQTGGRCLTCKRTFSLFKDAWQHMLSSYDHEVQAVEPERRG